MLHKTLTSFEVLAQPVAPGIANVPFAQQGSFLQVSNLDTKPVEIGVEYVGTPAFVTANGAVKLFCNITNQTGVADQYPTATFLTAPVGFKAQMIPAGATWLFGVQYLLVPPPAPITTPGTGGTPQNSVDARGVISLSAKAGSRLLVAATIRQVFNNYSPAGVLIDIAEGAYSLPLVGGPEQVF